METIPHKLVIKLKEIGFEWDLVTTANKKTGITIYHNCPTIYQVLKWLREEKKVYVMIDRSFSLKSWHYFIVIDDDFENPISQTVSHKQTWEQAAFKAIKYIIDNLLCQKKN